MPQDLHDLPADARHRTISSIGVDLTLFKKIVEHHGGKILAESELEETYVLLYVTLLV